MATAIVFEGANCGEKITFNCPGQLTPNRITKMADKTYFCSFCGKSQHEVEQLIAGPASSSAMNAPRCACGRAGAPPEKRPPLPLEVEARFDRTQREIEYEIDRWIDRLQTLKRLP